MDYLQSLLEYSETPLITAFLLGLLTAAAGVIMFCRMRYKNEK